MKKMVVYVLTFLLIVTSIFLIIVAILNISLLNKNYIIKVFEKNNYYQKMYNIINEDFKKYTLQSGFGDEVVKEIVNNEMVTQDINGIINSIYTKDGYSIQTKTVMNNLNNNIEKIIKEKKYILTETEKENIEMFKSIIEKSYANNIVYFESVIDVMKTIITKVYSFLTYLYLILITVIIFLLVLLKNLNKNIRIDYLQILFFTIGIFFITINLIMKLKIEIDNIFVFNQAISSVFIQIYKNIYNYNIIIITICVILGVINQIITRKEL